MNPVILVIIAVVVIAGGSALAYFLLNKVFAGTDKKPSDIDKKAAKEEAAAEKAKAADEAAQAKNRAAVEKRRAEMMKKASVEADPSVLQHRFIKKAADEISKFPQSIECITVMANRIDWKVKEEYNQYPSGNIFFDDPSLSRLEQGEMKLVAEHLFSLVKKTGFELEEIGSGEKGTYRYHVDKYLIKAL